jgi:charged multivesicular body protein 3
MQSINRFLYGPTPEDRVREWQTKLRRESRVLDREMRQVRPITASVRNSGINSLLQLDIETNKVRQTIKQLAKKGDNKSARILAREVVRSNKQKDRLSVSKARLGSIGTQLSQQLGTVNPLLQSFAPDFIPHSNGQGLWFPPEVHRDHEIV